jgi:glycine cleavage system H lipoate-binding protein/ABC-type phosphate transport system substrate-binding protein
MKKISVLIIGLSLLFYCNARLCYGTNDNQAGVQSNSTANKTLNILSSPELNSLTTKWVDEYARLNPATKISTSILSDNQNFTTNDLSFVSDKNFDEVNIEKTWKMVIGHNAIVPIINAKNPMLDEIYQQGISAEKFAQLLTNPELCNWKNLINNGQNAPIHCYITDNENIKSAIANFSKTNPSILDGKLEATVAEIITAVQKDIYAIGFCKLTDVRNATTNELVENIKLLPIDKNQNGRIDNFEKIYDNLNAFTRGVWIGKYPHDLCGSIYVISPSKPSDRNALAFLTWVLADGQKFLNPNGYSDLASTEIKSNIDVLMGTTIQIPETQKPLASLTWLFILLGFIFITAPILIIALWFVRNKKSIVSDNEINFTPAFDENSIIAPKGLYFDKTHTWAFMEKDGLVKVGIDDFLQHVTGTLTRIKMKEPGEKVRKGEKILTIIQNGKQLDIYTPISGTIKEQNQKLILDSSIMNSSPFSDGWVYVIEPKNWLREIQFLFIGENYKEWLQDEFARLKDFFAASLKSNTLVYSHIILQDGGELTDNVLADFGPEVWEDFQTKFIDTSK